ncbi:MAG: hypothetical protein EOS11_20025 [Mesorhizobium sp.]|nr:MAG: hypothetical protein EOS11_20025 [Mesorhizobium sp.]
MNSASARRHDLNQRYDFFGKRKSLINRTFSTAVSPASALAVSLLGYYTLAMAVGVDDNENQAISIYIRIVLFVLVLVAYTRPSPRPFSRLGDVLLPATVFLFIYMLRLFENIFISDVVVAGGAAVVMGMFCVGAVIPAYAISARYRGIRENEFIAAVVLLFICMAVGLILNRDALLESSVTRMGLDRINPISLGHLGFSFLIFFVISFRRSLWMKALAILAIPLLALVIIYTRSRGPYVAGSGALLLYVLLLKGTRRVWLISGLGLAAVIIGFVMNPDLVDIVTTQLSRTDINSDMSNQLRVIAFRGAWDQFLDHFLIGRYVVEQQTGYYPHNIYLESLMSVGAIGSIPFAMHIMLAVRSAVSIIRDKRSTIWATFTAVIFFKEALGGLVSGSIWGATGFWIASFLTIAVWYGGYPSVQRRPNQGAIQARGAGCP